MADNPISIKTSEDYDRIWEEANTKINEMVTRGKAEGWPDQRFVDEGAAIRLPYALAMTDPMNPVAIETGRKQVLEDYAKQEMNPRILDKTQYAEIYATVTEEVAKLNKFFGVNYPMPALVLADNYAEQTQGSPASFQSTGDMMIIDISIIEAIKQGKGARELLIHELGHRYTRDDFINSVKQQLATDWNVPFTEEMKIANRYDEKFSDMLAAKFGSADGLKEMILMTASSPAILQSTFVYETLGATSREQASVLFAAKTPQEQDALFAAYEKTTPEQRKVLAEHALQLEATVGNTGTHPTMLDRIKTAERYKANPLILNAVTDANDVDIVTALSASPSTSVSSTTPATQAALTK